MKMLRDLVLLSPVMVYAIRLILLFLQRRLNCHIFTVSREYYHCWVTSVDRDMSEAAEGRARGPYGFLFMGRISQGGVAARS
jgi:hypothetical protein